jgi:hypothetical protein
LALLGIYTGRNQKDKNQAQHIAGNFQPFSFKAQLNRHDDFSPDKLVERSEVPSKYLILA